MNSVAQHQCTAANLLQANLPPPNCPKVPTSYCGGKLFGTLGPCREKSIFGAAKRPQFSCVHAPIKRLRGCCWANTVRGLSKRATNPGSYFRKQLCYACYFAIHMPCFGSTRGAERNVPALVSRNPKCMQRHPTTKLADFGQAFKYHKKVVCSGTR